MPTNESFEILFIRSAVSEVKATTLKLLLLDLDNSSDKSDFIKRFSKIPKNKIKINKNFLFLTFN